MIIKQIVNDEAISFLKINKALKECVFVRPCDYWCGVYSDNTLVGVGGWTQKKRFIEIDGVFVKKNFRGEGIGYLINKHLLDYLEDKKVIVYARPIEAHILTKFNFIKTQTLKNGTAKMERKTNK